MMAQGRNLLDISDAVRDNADGCGGDSASLATSMPGNQTHTHVLMLQPRRGSTSALLTARMGTVLTLLSLQSPSNAG